MPVLGGFEKLRKVTISLVQAPSPPRGSTRLALDGFSCNLIFECLSFHSACWQYVVCVGSSDTCKGGRQLFLFLSPVVLVAACSYLAQ
jgi:hypothetical protein